MIKNFEEYINEDYFSKLASRKDNGNVRKENEITEDFVRSFVAGGFESFVKSVSIKKENGKTIVDIDGSFHLAEDTKEIPFQFGTVTGGFYCVGCKNLTSLEGCPEKVYGNFNCHGCDELTSLKGCPSYIGRNFVCNECKSLKSLEGCPKEVGGFYCNACGRRFTEEEVSSLCNVKGAIML